MQPHPPAERAEKKAKQSHGMRRCGFMVGEKPNDESDFFLIMAVGKNRKSHENFSHILANFASTGQTCGDWRWAFSPATTIGCFMNIFLIFGVCACLREQGVDRGLYMPALGSPRHRKPSARFGK